MSGQLEPELLVAYMAAAAREVQADGSLSDRSAWALDDAIAHLVSFGGDASNRPLALSSSTEDEGPALSALLLTEEPVAVEGDALDPAAHETAAVARLTEIRRDVELLRDGNRDAAARLRPHLDSIVDRLASDGA